ncbi:hypothetical protein SS50377_27665 [Spironucleus salmonicida]|uniref:Uncharacterized protein n=1 Tax=Spironucleus salmonicida TaxID=348837 RepID=V6LQN2_9EUKA|nr:hypothetical protein SS50377_27665 [Spironucleus salmonicida]|eukprot:EST46558.1 Hypothetical protein SS50377_13362 [Spironucleus salmonicida]
MQGKAPFKSAIKRPSSSKMQQNDVNLLNSLPKDLVHKSQESVTDLEQFFPSQEKYKEYANIPESEAEADNDSLYDLQIGYHNEYEKTEIEPISRKGSFQKTSSDEDTNIMIKIQSQLNQIIDEQQSQRRDIEEIKRCMSQDIEAKITKQSKAQKQMYQNQTILESMIKDVTEQKVGILEQKLEKLMIQLKSTIK